MAANKAATKSSFNNFILAAAILFSGICWYLSNGLTGDYWYLLWVAPIPVLLISLMVSPWRAFFISFTAYLIGRLSWFSYLVTVATIIPAIIFTIAPALVFALSLMASRKTVLKLDAWYSAFAFPVFFTAFEFLLFRVSPDGTAASIAYSQSSFLALIQIASITGITGITFLVCLIPSAIAISLYYRHISRKWIPVMITSAAIIFSTLIFGYARMNEDPLNPGITVGLVVLDEKSHKMGSQINNQDEIQHSKNYAQQISKLAAAGATVVVLPERALNINNETEAIIDSILSNTARQYHVSIVTGYTNFKSHTRHNSALVFDASGKLLADYDKTHLVKGLESQFEPGKGIAVFALNEIKMGTAICKDLDFPGFLRKYGQNNTAIMLIPAWDFVVDGWLHSRMAVLRGVENGFSEVRNAREGRLTISDCYGRITAEANSSMGQPVTLTGKVPGLHVPTLFTRYGDWFGFLMMAAAIFFLVLPFLITRSKVMVQKE